MRRRDLLKAIPLLMTPALAHADARPLRFIPDANLTALDPIWTTALVAQAHGYLVYDTLYRIDASNRSCRRCARGTTSRQTSYLDVHVARRTRVPRRRKVLAKDCVMSLKRWGLRDLFGPAVDQGGE